MMGFYHLAVILETRDDDASAAKISQNGVDQL